MKHVISTSLIFLDNRRSFLVRLIMDDRWVIGRFNFTKVILGNTSPPFGPVEEIVGKESPRNRASSLVQSQHHTQVQIRRVERSV